MLNETGEKGTCPMKVLNAVIPLASGPLFIHRSGGFVNRFSVHSNVEERNQVPKDFNSHSFRIQAATLAAMLGKGADKIQATGH